MLPMDHQYGTTHADSNGHVTLKDQTRDPKIVKVSYLRIRAGARKAVGSLLTGCSDVLMFWKLAPSECRQAGYVAPTIRLLHIV